MAVITGGSGVLGSAMSRYLASQGAKVAILARNEEKGNALAAGIRSEGHEAMFLKTDVTDRDILEKNCSDVLAAYGKVDILVNCAGGNMPGATIPPDKTIFDISIEDFRKVVDLNLFGTVIPTMVFAEAAIVNFTKYLAGELAIKFGNTFRVNAMAPGFFITEQNRTLMTNPDGSYSDRAKTILAHTPFGRFGQADELLGSLHYLVSDASRFVTGTVLVVDGGFDAFSI